MADWSLPVLGTEYTQWKQALNGRLVDAALMFDSGSTAAINIPTGAKRWNSSASKFEKFDGTSWSDLSTLYAISINGNAATATKLATPISIGGVSFDGSASISLPGVNAPGNQNTSGYANAAKYVYPGANSAGTPMAFQPINSGQNGGYLWCMSGNDSSVQQLLHSSVLQVSHASTASNANLLNGFAYTAFKRVTAGYGGIGNPTLIIIDEDSYSYSLDVVYSLSGLSDTIAVPSVSAVPSKITKSEVFGSMTAA